MNNCISKLLSLVLAATILLTAAVPVFAVGNDSNTQPESFSNVRMDEYVSSKVVAYLRMNDLITSTDNVCISQSIQIKNQDYDYDYLYFVFVNLCCVGFINVYFYDYTYYSRFISCEIPEIDNALINNYPITCFSYSNSLFLYCQNQLIQIAGKDANISAPPSSLSDNDWALIEITSINIPSTNTRGSSVDIFLSVPIVANQNDPDGDGLCWAACISSIGAYKTNSTYTPLSLYYSFYTTPGYTIPSQYEKPTGIQYFEEILFEYVYDLDYSCYSGGLTFGGVSSVLATGDPIYAGILETSTSELGHAVVICGAYLDPNTGNFFYYLMDPNENQYIEIDVYYTNSTHFTYRTNWGWNQNYVFTYWIRHYC